MVSPVYPDAARKRGIEGWVELAFTVQTNGSVDQVEVRNASPAEVFDDAAIARRASVALRTGVAGW